MNVKIPKSEILKYISGELTELTINAGTNIYCYFFRKHVFTPKTIGLKFSKSKTDNHQFEVINGKAAASKNPRYTTIVLTLGRYLGIEEQNPQYISDARFFDGDDENATRKFTFVFDGFDDDTIHLITPETLSREWTSKSGVAHDFVFSDKVGYRLSTPRQNRNINQVPHRVIEVSIDDICTDCNCTDCRFWKEVLCTNDLARCAGTDCGKAAICTLFELRTNGVRLLSMRDYTIIKKNGTPHDAVYITFNKLVTSPKVLALLRLPTHSALNDERSYVIENARANYPDIFENCTGEWLRLNPELYIIANKKLTSKIREAM